MKLKQFILRFLVFCLILSQLAPCVQAAEPTVEGKWNAPAVTFADDGRDTFAGYIDRAFAGAAAPKKAAIHVGGRLTGLDAALYARLKEQITRVASGAVHDTVFSFTPQELGIKKYSFTAQELGISSIAVNNSFTEDAKRGAVLAVGLDLRTVLECLMEDLPYELYWFDKVTGAYEAYSFSGNYHSISVASINIYMYVSVDYARASTAENPVQGTTQTRSDLSAVEQAVKNARQIVAEHADEADYQKLMSYVRKISSLSDSNYAAASDPDALYSDPWQLIYVFDEDPTTKVVCEGFSKAMQYLCDMSTFRSNIICYSVMGSVKLSSGGEGGHMWNIIHMDDGRNYMVDVTNYKSMDSVFRGVTGSVEDGYTLAHNQKTLHYDYYDQSLRLFTREELTLSAEDYTVHEHSFAAMVVAPTCTKKGYTSYTCSCGDGYIDAYVPALGHDMVIDPAVPATCTETGLSEGSHCTRCDYRIAQQTVAALGHDIIGEPEIPATCTESGLTAGGYCSRCDYRTAKQVIPALGHDMVIDPAVSATCTETGLSEGSHCTRCDYKVAQKTVEARGHNIVIDPAVPATCTESGLTEGRHCTRCDYQIAQKTIEALGHVLVIDVAVPATCTQSGLSEGSHCTRCDYRVAQQTVEALGHDIIGEQAVAATCTESGLTAGGYCSRCDYRSTKQIVPALGHDMVTDPAVPATCTETGLTEGSHCTRCDYAVKGEEIVPIGHSYAKAVTEPTCTEDGVTIYTCTHCGESYEERTAAPGHSYQSGACIRCGAKEPGYVCDGGEGCYSSAFADAPKPGNWAHAGIDYCVEKGLMKGVSDGIFNPNGTVTRGQLVTILYRIAGEPDFITDKAFSDVDAGRYFTKAVLWAAEKEIVTGYADGTFQPNREISREQIATILYRYAGAPDVKGTLDFPDAGQAGSYARNALLWATQNAFITGIKTSGSTLLSPKANATRAQIASIIMRYLEAEASK